MLTHMHLSLARMDDEAKREAAVVAAAMMAEELLAAGNMEVALAKAKVVDSHLPCPQTRGIFR